MSEMPKMDPHARDLWAAALTSGDYVQNRGRLRNQSGAMCCLGVLCDLYRLDRGVGSWGDVPSLKEGIAFIVDERPSYVFPPDEVLAWAGISNEPFDGKTTIAGLLAGKNDGAKWSFAEIAAFVSDNL